MCPSAVRTERKFTVCVLNGGERDRREPKVVRPAFRESSRGTAHADAGSECATENTPIKQGSWRALVVVASVVGRMREVEDRMTVVDVVRSFAGSQMAGFR